MKHVATRFRLFAVDKNDNHDPKTGRFAKTGTGGKALPGFKVIESTKADAEYYKRLLEKHSGDHVRAAIEYIGNKFSGRCISIKVGDKTEYAYFTHASKGKLKNCVNTDAIKAELISYIGEVLTECEYHQRNVIVGSKHEHDGTIVFHEYRKSINLNGVDYDVQVDVRARST